MRNSDQGFTVVESLIAILLLVIMLTGGMAFYYHSNALYYSGLHNRMATSLASSQMEVCRNVGYAALPGGDCPEETDTALTTGPLAVLSGKRTVAVSDVGAVKQLTVTVGWIDPSKDAQSVTLQTYVGP
jgi:hypothetical protein